MKILIVTEELLYKFQVPDDFTDDTEKQDKWFCQLKEPYKTAFHFSVEDRTTCLEDEHEHQSI